MSYLIIQCTYVIVFGVYTMRNFRVFYKKYIQPLNLPAIVSRRMTRNGDMLIQINNKWLFSRWKYESPADVNIWQFLSWMRGYNPLKRTSSGCMLRLKYITRPKVASKAMPRFYIPLRFFTESKMNQLLMNNRLMGVVVDGPLKGKMCSMLSTISRQNIPT